jgi:hypothetical protein
VRNLPFFDFYIVNIMISKILKGHFAFSSSHIVPSPLLHKPCNLTKMPHNLENSGRPGFDLPQDEGFPLPLRSDPLFGPSRVVPKEILSPGIKWP